ncbi:MAG: FtsW/RodA/SpoVE family cell cycle protein, partial [Acidobacteriota bacterium]|nr:FtsW/RodA/SpoVE family cell cycle protein [Acidobacteriota bacterium]
MEKAIQLVFYISWALWLLYLYILLFFKKAGVEGAEPPSKEGPSGHCLKNINRWWVSFIGMFLSTIAIFSLFFLLTQDFKSDSNFFIENYEYKITGQQKEIIIGSSEEGADISLENASAAERHLKIILKGSDFEVQDISDDKRVDINGRYLNRATLKVGDVIEINGKEKINVLKINPQFPLGRSITVSITKSGKKEASPVTLRTLLNKRVTIGETGAASAASAASLEYTPNKRFLGTSIYYVIVFALVFLLCTAIYFYLQNRFNGALLLLMMVSLAFGAGFVPASAQAVIMLLFLPCIVYVEKRRKTRWNRGSLLLIFLYGCVFVSPILLRMDGDFTLDYAHSSRKDAASIRVLPAGVKENSFELFDKREKLDYGKTYEIILGHTRYGLRVDYTGVSLSPRDPEKIRISRDFSAIIGDLSEVSPGNNYVYLKYPHDFAPFPANTIADREKISVTDAKGNGITLSKTVNENYRIYLFGLIFIIVLPFWVFGGLYTLRFFEKKRPKSFCLFNYKSFIVYNFVYFMLGLGYVVFGGLALYNNSYFKNFAKFRVSALPLFVVLFLGLLLLSRYNRFLVFLSRLLRQRKYQVPLLVFFILLMGAIYNTLFLAAALLFFIFVFGFRLRKVIIFEYKSARSYPLDVKKFMETPVCSFEDRENRRLFFGLGGLLNNKGWNYLLMADLLLLLALFFIVLQIFLGGELGISVGGFLFFPIELGKILLAIYFADWVSRIDKGMEFNVLWVYGLVLAPFILLIVFLKDFSPLLIFVFVFLYHIIKIKKSILFKLLLIVSTLVIMKQVAAAFNNYTFPAHSFAVLFSIAILFILLRVWFRRKPGNDTGRYGVLKKIVVTLALISLLGVGNYVLRYGHMPVSRVLGDRVSLWLNPWQDYNLSFQYINSLWLMKGTGTVGKAADSLTAAARVPVVEKDLSFALYVSTLGVAGIVLLLLTVFLAAGVVFRRGGSSWHRYVMEFLAVIFIAQFLVPAMYTVGLLPLMGQPLPFLSYSNNLLLLFALPFSFLMFIHATETNEKFLEVQKPFFKKVSDRRRHHFLIFCLIIMLIASAILLRLYSISYPKDIEEKTDIVYLESFHDYGSIFKIKLKSGTFFLTPLARRVEVNGKEFPGDIDIHNGDIIAIGDNRFQFKVYPGEYLYKEVFCRPIRSLFPGPASVQYIGGWP